MDTVDAGSMKVMEAFFDCPKAVPAILRLWVLLTASTRRWLMNPSLVSASHPRSWFFLSSLRNCRLRFRRKRTFSSRI